MIDCGKFTDGPFVGLSITVAPSEYLDFVNRTRPLPWAETVCIDAELRKRKYRYPGVCPICGHYSARNNRFAAAVNSPVNRKGRR